MELPHRPNDGFLESGDINKQGSIAKNHTKNPYKSGASGAILVISQQIDYIT